MALAKDRDTVRRAGDEVVFQVADGVTIYAGALVCLNGDGKAVPASGFCMAHLMATGESHPVAARFKLNRFATGHILDEEGTGSQHNLH